MLTNCTFLLNFEYSSFVSRLVNGWIAVSRPIARNLYFRLRLPELFRKKSVDRIALPHKAFLFFEISTYPEDFSTISAQLEVILGPTEFYAGEFE